MDGGDGVWDDGPLQGPYAARGSRLSITSAAAFCAHHRAAARSALLRWNLRAETVRSANHGCHAGGQTLSVAALAGNFYTTGVICSLLLDGRERDCTPHTRAATLCCCYPLRHTTLSAPRLLRAPLWRTVGAAAAGIACLGSLWVADLCYGFMVLPAGGAMCASRY